jgi:hypothetical protein
MVPAARRSGTSVAKLADHRAQYESHLQEV